MRWWRISLRGREEIWLTFTKCEKQKVRSVTSLERTPLSRTLSMGSFSDGHVKQIQRETWNIPSGVTDYYQYALRCFPALCDFVGLRVQKQALISYLRSAVQLNKTDCTLHWTAPLFTHFKPSRYVNSSVYLPDSTWVPTLHSLLSPHSQSSPAQPLLPLVLAIRRAPRWLLLNCSRSEALHSAHHRRREGRSLSVFSLFQVKSRMSSGLSPWDFPDRDIPPRSLPFSCRSKMFSFYLFTHHNVSWSLETWGENKIKQMAAWGSVSLDCS